MARLAALESGLFYPTDEKVYRYIANHLTVEQAPGGAKKRARLLDPCAGTGIPAAHVGAAVDAETFGIELEAERALQCRDNLDHALHAGAFGSKINHHSFSILYLNPPYDTDDEKKRMEHSFLTNMTGSRQVLCTNGVLIYIIPQAVLALSARYLANYYINHRIYRFPDPEFDAYGQVVVMATRRERPLPAPDVAAKIAAMAESDDLPELPEYPDPDLGPINVPILPVGEILFAPLVFNAEMAMIEVRRCGVMTLPKFTESVYPPKVKYVRPLMPFRKGHLAIMVASGLVNNRPITHPVTGQRLLVKGRLEKVMVNANTPEDDDNEDVEITREIEKLKTSLQTLDLLTGTVTILTDQEPLDSQATT